MNVFVLHEIHPYRYVFIFRVQDLRELGELSPHWDNLRKEVITRYGGLFSSYQETLAELDKITGMTDHVSKCYIYTCVHIVHLHTQMWRRELGLKAFWKVIAQIGSTMFVGPLYINKAWLLISLFVLGGLSSALKGNIARTKIHKLRGKVHKYSLPLPLQHCCL